MNDQTPDYEMIRLALQVAEAELCAHHLWMQPKGVRYISCMFMDKRCPLQDGGECHNFIEKGAK